MKSTLITNRKRAKQILAFDGMTYGDKGARPTDIDFSIDYKGEVFVFGEVKGGTMALTIGQRKHLEFIVRGLRKGGKEAYAILCHHTESNCEEDVPVAESNVAAVFDGNVWEKDVEMTAHQFIHMIVCKFIEEKSA